MNKPCQKKLLRSPFVYFGSKSYGIAKLIQVIPDHITKICSPFIGGGSLELACCSQGVEVRGYDINPELINLWDFILNRNDELVDELKTKYYGKYNSEQYNEFFNSYLDVKSDLTKACYYFIFSICSWGGRIRGSIPLDNYYTNAKKNKVMRSKLIAIADLKNLPKDLLTVENLSFEQSILKHPDHFLYLDPPFVGLEQVYGHKKITPIKAFDHELLAKTLSTRGQWMLSYNNCDLVNDLYRKNRKVFIKWKYMLNKDSVNSEILILSEDFSRLSNKGTLFETS